MLAVKVQYTVKFVAIFMTEIFNLEKIGTSVSSCVLK